jgi:hypothetical protein
MGVNAIDPSARGDASLQLGFQFFDRLGQIRIIWI